MRKQKHNNWQVLCELVKYLSSGTLGVLSDILILYLLVEYSNLYLLVSVSIASIVSTVLNYIIQKFWTFKSHAQFFTSFPKYVLVFLFNYFFTIGFMFITVEVYNFHYLLMKIASFAFITIWTYLLYKYFVYKSI